tara:strand:- start:250 stop:591 length:342 start_codon:yes stop_codon:yes gene_type:complete
MLIKPVFPIVDYIINYDYISTQLCENIEKPELKCNGKCHLAKELAKASEIEKPLNSDKKQNTKHEIEVLFCESITNFNSAKFLNFELNENISFYQNFYTSVVFSSLFHPPILA